MDAIDRRFDQVLEEMRAMRVEMRTEFAAVRSDISSLRDTLLHVAFGMVGVLIAAIAAIAVALIA